MSRAKKRGGRAATEPQWLASLRASFQAARKAADRDLRAANLPTTGPDFFLTIGAMAEAEMATKH
jgi:hypothetical protein